MFAGNYFDKYFWPDRSFGEVIAAVLRNYVFGKF
jgi:hypothetical protein